jgi:hypothetical protein
MSRILFLFFGNLASPTKRNKISFLTTILKVQEEDVSENGQPVDRRDRGHPRGASQSSRRH